MKPAAVVVVEGVGSGEKNANSGVMAAVMGKAEGDPAANIASNCSTPPRHEYSWLFSAATNNIGFAGAATA